MADRIHQSGQAIVWSGPEGAGRALLGAAQGRRADDGPARAGLSAPLPPDRGPGAAVLACAALPAAALRRGDPSSVGGPESAPATFFSDQIGTPGPTRLVAQPGGRSGSWGLGRPRPPHRLGATASSCLFGGPRQRRARPRRAAAASPSARRGDDRLLGSPVGDDQLDGGEGSTRIERRRGRRQGRRRATRRPEVVDCGHGEGHRHRRPRRRAARLRGGHASAGRTPCV